MKNYEKVEAKGIRENIEEIVQCSAMKALLKSQTAGNEKYARRLGLI